MRPKYKVGDTVVCVSIDDYPIWRRDIGDELKSIYGYGWKKNKVFQIIRISNLEGQHGTTKEPIYWYNDIDGYYGVYESALKLLSQKEEVKVFGIVEFTKTYYK